MCSLVFVVNSVLFADTGQSIRHPRQFPNESFIPRNCRETSGRPIELSLHTEFEGVLFDGVIHYSATILEMGRRILEKFLAADRSIVFVPDD